MSSNVTEINTGNVVELNTIEKFSGENVVERIREVLEMAEAGEISNILILGTTTDGAVLSTVANNSDPFQMIGQMEVVKNRFINFSIE